MWEGRSFCISQTLNLKLRTLTSRSEPWRGPGQGSCPAHSLSTPRGQAQGRCPRPRPPCQAQQSPGQAGNGRRRLRTQLTAAQEWRPAVAPAAARLLHRGERRAVWERSRAPSPAGTTGWGGADGAGAARPRDWTMVTLEAPSTEATSAPCHWHEGNRCSGVGWAGPRQQNGGPQGSRDPEEGLGARRAICRTLGMHPVTLWVTAPETCFLPPLCTPVSQSGHWPAAVLSTFLSRGTSDAPTGTLLVCPRTQAQGLP